MLRTKSFQLLAWLLCASVVGIFSGCINDDIEVEDVDVPPGCVKVNFTVPEMSMATRGTAAESHECAIKDVHILFYDAAGAYVDFSHSEVTGGASGFVFRVPSKLQAGAEYKTLVIGNSHGFIPTPYDTFDAYLQGQITGRSYSDARLKLCAAGGALNKSVAGSNGLPMYGEFVNERGVAVPFIFTGDADTRYDVEGTVRFNRVVCRVDINNLVAKHLIIDQVKLCNRRQGAYYFHQETLYGQDLSNTGLWSNVGNPELSGDGLTATQSLDAELYCYPNSVPVVAQNDNATTYVMIKGYYQDGVNNTTSNPTAKATYYRVNLADNGSSQLLRRNHIYRLNITHVAKEGASTEEGAVSATAPLIRYSVNDVWTDPNEATVVTDSKGNTLSISRAMVSFGYETAEAELVKVKVAGKDGGLTWHATWVTDDMTVGDYAEFAMNSINNETLSIQTRSDNTTDFLRRARLKVWATGGSIDPSSPLTTYIDIYQFNRSGNMRILMVDNQVGTLSCQVPGEGGTMRFVVNTGSRNATYKAEWGENQPLNATLVNNGVGNNGATLEVAIPANTTGAERAFSVIVKRVEDGVTAESDPNPVSIQLTQPVTTKLYEISKNISTDSKRPTRIEGYNPVLYNGIANPYSPNFVSFSVKLYNPELHKFRVVSNFLDEDVSIFPAYSDKSTVSNVNPPKNNTLTNLNSGSFVYVVPFATGPGDPTIPGSLTIDVLDADGNVLASENVYISITTDCIIEDILVFSNYSYYYVLTDRNIGVPRYDADGNKVPALFYTQNNKTETWNNQGHWRQSQFGPDAMNHSFSEYRGALFNIPMAATDASAAKQMFMSDNTSLDGSEYLYNAENIKRWTTYDANFFGVDNQIGMSKGRHYIFQLEVKEVGPPRKGNHIGCWLAAKEYTWYTGGLSYLPLLMLHQGTVYCATAKLKVEKLTSSYATTLKTAPTRMVIKLTAEEAAKYKNNEI